MDYSNVKIEKFEESGCLANDLNLFQTPAPAAPPSFRKHFKELAIGASLLTHRRTVGDGQINAVG